MKPKPVGKTDDLRCSYNKYSVINNAGVYGVLSPSTSLLADSHIQLIKDIKFILFNIQELYKQVLNLGLILT